ncbi:MAG: cobalamin-dependent protein [Sedimentisphaerales bacterium]|nr:cobalamin-dependent protein [Sedimentisphaerales bacterium]
MRLLFINPPNIDRSNKSYLESGKIIRPEYASFPPLGIGYLAAIAEKEGCECQVLDLNVRDWPSKKYIQEISPDMVLLSAMTSQYRAVKIIAGELKGEVPTVLGGPHASIFKEKLLDNGLDIIAVGEGENTIRSLVKNFPDNLEQVSGIIFKKNGCIENTGDPEGVEDCESLPFPAWHYFDLDLYANDYHGRKCLPMISSRGCPFHCVYCFKGVFGDKIRMRSAESIFQEILFFKEKYNIGAILFQDDLFSIRRSRVEEFCRLLIDNKADIIWRCLVRADQVDFELLKLMQQAGCHSVAFGIESGNQEVVDKVGKKMELEQAVTAIKDCNKLGIISKGYYMIGLPWDTPQTAMDTIRFARKNRTSQLQFTIPTAFPGTELWEIGKRKGLAVEDCVESFSWDESRPPFSFSDHLTEKQIEGYILTARNIGILSVLQRKLRVTKLKDYPRLLKKVFCKASSLIYKKIKLLAPAAVILILPYCQST